LAAKIAYYKGKAMKYVKGLVSEQVERLCHSIADRELENSSAMDGASFKHCN
jgi:hypothetical protein